VFCLVYALVVFEGAKSQNFLPRKTLAATPPPPPNRVVGSVPPGFAWGSWLLGKGRAATPCLPLSVRPAGSSRLIVPWSAGGSDPVRGRRGGAPLRARWRSTLAKRCGKTLWQNAVGHQAGEGAVAPLVAAVMERVAAASLSEPPSKAHRVGQASGLRQTVRQTPLERAALQGTPRRTGKWPPR
jgi:hypothetical protein